MSRSDPEIRDVRDDAPAPPSGGSPGEAGPADRRDASTKGIDSSRPNDGIAEVDVPSIDWDRVHSAIQHHLAALTDRVLAGCPGAVWDAGRTTARAFRLFSYRVFYRLDGSTRGIELNDRATGPRFEVLRRVPSRVCIVSGVDKRDSLRGALAARLVTELVVDEATARALTG